MDQASEAATRPVLSAKLRKDAAFYSTLGYVGVVIRGLLDHIDQLEKAQPLTPENCRVVRLKTDDPAPPP
jgi:hypothetical protein